ncbi:MAG: S-layer homology domain-containing protein [Clostridia bacterium]|nr:S-layer homology domain-containing protein [Clostridia bacterium]
MPKKSIALFLILLLMIQGIALAEQAEQKEIATDSKPIVEGAEACEDTLKDKLGILTKEDTISALPGTEGLKNDEIKIGADVYKFNCEDNKSYKVGDSAKVYFQINGDKKCALMIQRDPEPTDFDLYLFFRNLGIMPYYDGAYNAENRTTRAEAARYAVILLGYQDAASDATNSKEKKQCFNDIANHWAYGYVSVGKSIGLINGDQKGDFRPDDDISCEQILAVIIRMLGYEPAAKKYGGYPHGYIKITDELGITKGMEKAADHAATRGITSRLLFKSLFVKMMKQTGYKPVIYLYPSNEQQISVRLKLKGKLTYTYPQYNDGWKVTAKPDGTIVNAEDGVEYSYLFWEGQFQTPGLKLDRGFVVKGEETTKFLQEKLSQLGLTPRERNEFIVYWAPKMQSNKFNLITFAGKEYEEAVPLEISPKPNSVLRIFMIYQSLDEPIKVQPQEVKSFERKGFTVVEWGGTEVK